MKPLRFEAQKSSVSLERRVVELERRFAADRELSMPLAPLGEPSPGAELEVKRVLERALDELYFSVVLAPGYHGEGPTVGAAVEFHYWSLPPGAVTAVHSHRPLRAHWPLTRARITVWVWTDAAVPGNFTMRLNIAQTADGVGVGAPVYPVFNHDFVIAPAAANTVAKFNSIVPAASVLKTSPAELVKFYVARLNDGNANNLYLHCALIELLEVT